MKKTAITLFAATLVFGSLAWQQELAAATAHTSLSVDLPAGESCPPEEPSASVVPTTGIVAPASDDAPSCH